MVANRANTSNSDTDFDHSSFTYALQRNVRWNLRAYHCAGSFEGDDVVQVDPLGTAAEIRELINAYVDVVWRGAHWGVYMGEDFYVEFDVGLSDADGGDDEVLEYFSLVVVGEGDASDFLTEFAATYELVFCDANSGEVVEKFSALDCLVAEAPEATSSLSARSAVVEKRQANPLEGLRFDDVWVNLTAAQNNLVALNGHSVLIATASIEDLYRIIDEYEAHHEISTQSRMLWAGSQCHELSSVTEIVENAESQTCQISFSGMSWPVDVAFTSNQDKSEFMDVILTRVSAVNHVVPEKKGVGAAEILLLVLALTCLAVGTVEQSLWIVLASLAVFFFVVASLMRSGSKQSRMKTVYRFSH